MDIMRRQWVLRLLGLTGFVAILLAGCSGGGETSAGNGQSRLTIQLVTAEQAPAGAMRTLAQEQVRQVQPGDRDFLTRIDVRVEAADLPAPISQSVTLSASEQTRVTVNLVVPTGDNRRVIVGGFNGLGEEVFHGEATVNLSQNVQEVTITLLRQFLPSAVSAAALANRSFAFSSGSVFGISGPVTLSFGAVVDNSGPFFLSFEGGTANGTVTLSAPAVNSSQLRQEASGSVCNFDFTEGSLQDVSTPCDSDDTTGSLRLGSLVSAPPELAVNQTPNASIDSPAEDVTVTAGQTVSFAATCTDTDGNTPFTFAWNFGGGADNVAVEDPGAVTFTTTGTFTVTFTCTDALGATDATPDTRIVTVEPALPPGPPPNTVRIDSPSGPVTSGTQFTVPIILNPGEIPVVSYLFDLTFDPAVIQITDIEAGEFPFDTIVKNTTFAPGTARFTAHASTFDPEVNAALTLARVTFQVVGNPGDTTTLSLTVPSDVGVLVNNSFEAINLEEIAFEPGSVTVQ
jgi:PKD repeat protein